MTITVAVENSTWNNIGDSFYQYSIQNILRSKLRSSEVVSFDGPISRAFRPRNFKKNAYDIRMNYRADHFVLSGPIFGESFFDNYSEFIRALKSRGSTYSILSLHVYAEGELLRKIMGFLEKYPPLAIHTRDRESFEKISSARCICFDGVCMAFFVAKLPGLPKVSQDNPYICSSFHSMPEPELALNTSDAGDCGFEELSVQKRGNKAWRISRHFDFMRKYPSHIGKWEILRPVHSFYPSPHLIFSRPNSYISYNPKNFLAIYQGAEAVITDRVHAAVPVLSFGGWAHITRIDSRGSLLDKFQLKKEGEFYSLDSDQIGSEYNRLSDWIVNDYSKALEDAHG